MEEQDVTAIAVVADGSDQAIAINAAIAAATTRYVQLPAGEFWIGSTITVPDGKVLIGVGRGETLLKVLPGFGPLPTGNGAVAVGSDAGLADLSIDVGKTNNGLEASLRVHGVVAYGERFLIEDVGVSNATGYAFFSAGRKGTFTSNETVASGVFRDCYAENSNVLFETNVSNGVLFENCVGADGDGDIALEAAFHVLAGSSNITFLDCAYDGRSQAINVTANTAFQSGIVFQNFSGTTGSNALAAYIGGAGGNEVSFIGSTIAAQAANAVNIHNSTFSASQSHFTSQRVAVALLSGTATIVDSSAASRTGADFAGATYGAYSLGTMSWDGGYLFSKGGPGSAAHVGNVEVSASTVIAREPVLTLGEGVPSVLAYSENEGPVALTPGAFVTDADTLGFGGGSLIVSMGDTGRAEDRLSIVASDGLELAGAQILYQGVVFGSWEGGQEGAPLAIAFSDAATAAGVQAVLRAVVYENLSERPAETERSIEIALSDGHSGRAAASMSVAVAAHEDAPATRVGTAEDARIFYFEQAAAVLIAPTARVEELDSDHFAAATLTVDLPSGQAGEILSIRPGEGEGDIRVAGAELYLGEVRVGTFAGGADGASLIVTFETGVDETAVQAVVRALAYENSSDATEAERIVTVAIDDGRGGRPNPLTVTILTAGADDPSLLDLNGAAEGVSATLAFTEQDAPVRLAPEGLLDDPDLNSFQGAVLTIRFAEGGSAGDRLLVAPGGGITVEGAIIRYEGAEIARLEGGEGGHALRIEFVGGGREAAEALLRALSFDAPGDTPAPGDRRIEILFSDGRGGNAAAEATVAVTAVLDPVRLQIPSEPVSYAEQGGAAPVASGGRLLDPEQFGLTGHSLSIAIIGATAEESLTLAPGGAISCAADRILFEGEEIGRLIESAGVLTVLFAPAAGAAGADALIEAIRYSNSSEKPAAEARIRIALSAADGNEISESEILVATQALEDAAEARADSARTDEDKAVTGDLFADNGAGADFDPDGPALTVASVNGLAANVGQIIVLASGAVLKVERDGRYHYDPAGKFDSLSDRSTGAANSEAVDSFTYTLAGGTTATVTITIDGIASPGDRLAGNSGANLITGTDSADVFRLDQGGDDEAAGGGQSDAFIFGATLDSADRVDGGAGTDQLSIQGDYWGARALTLGAVQNVEQIVLLAGNNTAFGDPGTGFYSYSLTALDGNVAAGGLLQVDGSRLRAGEDFTFDGSSETDGSFFVWGGKGADRLTGGAGNDGFLFRGSGNWGAQDRVDGGAGVDQLSLRGQYAGANAIVMGAGQIVGIEQIVILSGSDVRFGPLTAPTSYDIRMNDGNVAAGQRITVDAASLREGETLTLDASAETDGSYRIFGGRDSDVITGSANGDSIRGGRGADVLTGGGGADVFVYRSASESSGAGFDRLIGFDWSEDRIDLPFAISGWADPVKAGRLDGATFEADLAAAVDAALGERGALLFTADGGEYGGRTFLVVDGDGDGRYRNEQDYVIEIVAPAEPIPPGAGLFV